jgi:hypothetical protein
MTSKEYVFSVMDEVLIIDPVTESKNIHRREEYDIKHIIHMKSDASSSNNFLLGAVLAIFGILIILIAVLEYQGGPLTYFGGLLLIIGVIVALLKSKTSKLTLTLSNGIQNEYTMSTDKDEVLELMNKIFSNRKPNQFYN